MKKSMRLAAAVLAAAMTLCLCGCGGVGEVTLDPQELYRLPELPVQYTALNDQLNAILEEGAEYAAPTAGSNIQPVQMVDLDGDGREEAVAFFRRSDDEKPLKIYIFQADGDTYRRAALIEGSGSSIYSISYNDLDGDGHTELVVGWRASTDLQALTVYTLTPEGPAELVRTDYVRYAMADFSGDGTQEIVVLRSDQSGMGVAVHYGWDSGTLSAQSTARVSMTMAELSQQGQVAIGFLRDGSTALFVTGVGESSRAITDVLAMRGGELNNIVLSNVTGYSTEIAQFCGLFARDINEDGIMEVPWPVTLPAWDGSAAPYQRIEWRSYDLSGQPQMVMNTYHSTEDGWYFVLPDKWKYQITVDRTVGVDEVGVTFYALNAQGQVTQPVLRVSVITGSGMEQRAVRGGRFILGRQGSAIYVAEFLSGNEGWELAMTEDEVREAFHQIETEWAAENS